MSQKRDIPSEVRLNKEHRMKILDLENKILQMRLERLSLLKQHYEEFWLDIELKCFDTKIRGLVAKANFMVQQKRSEHLKGLVLKLEEESRSLDIEIIRAKTQLEKFKKLDPELLSEYRELKDELECQDMLIQYSEYNTKNEGD